MGAEQNRLPKDYQEKLKSIKTNKYEGPLPLMVELALEWVREAETHLSEAGSDRLHAPLTMDQNHLPLKSNICLCYHAYSCFIQRTFWCLIDCSRILRNLSLLGINWVKRLKMFIELFSNNKIFYKSASCFWRQLAMNIKSLYAFAINHLRSSQILEILDYDFSDLDNACLGFAG